VQHSGSEAFPKGAVKASTPPKNSTEPSAPVTKAPEERGHAVGDTVNLNGGHGIAPSPRTVRL
jgi:hypothetical protein